MFKKIVKMIAEANTREEIDAACAAIDKAFQAEKITWTDHEILYALIKKID